MTDQRSKAAMDEWLDVLIERQPGECDCRSGSYSAGAAVAFGLMGMAEAISANHTPIRRCVSCGFDGRNDHSNSDYDRSLYRETGTKLWYCGECADQLGVDEE